MSADRNGLCWCGSGRKLKRCHRNPVLRIPPRPIPPEIDLPPYVSGAATPVDPLNRPPELVDRMRRTGALAGEVLGALLDHVGPGVIPRELDDICFQLAIDGGAYPSPLGYGPSDNPFPASLCVSRNEVVCHGIPDDQPLVEGDIVSLDVTVFREGVHGDTCASIGVGDIDHGSALLIQAADDAMNAAIAAVRPGLWLSVIGEAIEGVAKPLGLGIVRNFVGHGIGSTFHDEPHVPHYRHVSAVRLESGMTFTIEPMITAGSGRVRMLEDQWTAVTSDGSRCAQSEHTILVGPDRAEVLTARSG